MEQLRQVGEALGGIHALMAFADDLRINPRQCHLLADACALAFASVAAEVRAHLRFDERLAKWKPLESPLRELHRAVRDAEGYVRYCLEPRDWWARAAAATHSADCVELHLHNLLWCVAVVLEAVEAVSEVTGSDPDETARRRTLFAKDYDRDMLEPRLFRLRLGGRYLATRELAAGMDMAWKEDRWLLSQLIEERKGPASPERLTRHEHRLADLLAAPREKVHPASVLLQGGDFQIRRRIAGSLKEVQWRGEAFAVKHFVGADADAVGAEIAVLTSVAHPNVAHCRYCFHDEDRREFFLVMDQLMTKDLGSYVKEVNSAKRRTIPFPLVAAVDVMLQIARGMEYLHSRNIYHGDLNPSNVLVKTRHADAHQLHVKVAGFGVTVAASPRAAPANANVNPCIWYAPEVLEQEGYGAKRTDKADVYSFSMICFELLTGKIPFEDNHLQGEHMSKNIRAGERPLFPLQAPKYVTSLTKRCWHADPAQRPAFSSICRVLRYVKRYLVMNPPDQSQPDAPAPLDYLDVEASLLRRFPEWQGNAAPRVSDVPFQMYAYRVMEKDKTRAIQQQMNRDKASDSSSDGNSLCGDDGTMQPDPEPPSTLSRATSWSLPDRNTSRKVTSRLAGKRSSSVVNIARSHSMLMDATAGPPQKSKSIGVVRPPQIATRPTPRIKSDGHLNSPILPSRRRVSRGGHLSDSELARNGKLRP